jgi:hypothetical protein
MLRRIPQLLMTYRSLGANAPNASSPKIHHVVSAQAVPAYIMRAVWQHNNLLRSPMASELVRSREQQKVK